MRRVSAMGTHLTVTVEAATRADALTHSEVVVRSVEAAEARLSTWRTDSALAAMNRAPAGAWVPVGSELASELAAALAYSRETRGAFDPCVGSLVEAWDLRGPGRIPDDARVADAVAACRGGIEVGADVARRLDSRTVVEEGGFGKGAALDAALAALASTGARSAEIDFGGQLAWFDRGGLAWHELEIAHPRNRERIVCRIRTTCVSASTTGNGERARVVESRRMGHILDPRDGTMARDFGSVIVLADSGLRADALSTGLFVLGPDEGLAIAGSLAGVDAVYVEELSDGRLRVRATAAVARELVLIDALADLDVLLVHSPSGPTR